MAEMTKILFLDDEPAVLDGLRRQLSPFNAAWNMRFETSPLYALEMLDKEPFDVVVTDLKMPVISGDTIANLFGSLSNPPGIVVLSGHSSKEELEDIITLPFEYLAKPCQSADIVMAVSRVLYNQPSRISQLYDEVLELVVLKLRERGILKTDELPDEYRTLMGIRTIAEILGENLSIDLKQ